MSGGAGTKWRCLPALLTAALVGPSVALAQGEQEGFYPGDLGQALAAITIFIVLFAILRRWAWNPVVSALRSREESIAQALDRAKKREEESQDLLEHYRSRLHKAEEDARELMLRARKDAAEAREQVLDAARAEGQKHAQQALADIEHAKRQALKDLYDNTAQLATEVAASLVEKQLTPEDHRRLFQQSLEEIGQRCGKEG